MGRKLSRSWKALPILGNVMAFSLLSLSCVCAFASDVEVIAYRYANAMSGEAFLIVAVDPSADFSDNVASPNPNSIRFFKSRMIQNRNGRRSTGSQDLQYLAVKQVLNPTKGKLQLVVAGEGQEFNFLQSKSESPSWPDCSFKRVGAAAILGPGAAYKLISLAPEDYANITITSELGTTVTLEDVVAKMNAANSISVEPTESSCAKGLGSLSKRPSTEP